MYFIDVMGTTQENLAEEALEVARRILGPDVEIKFEVTYINKIMYMQLPHFIQ